jgi:glycosyltransferase involved in cell wall biosynthesis
MNRAIDATASCEAAVRCIDDRIDVLLRDVADCQLNAAIIDPTEHVSSRGLQSGFTGRIIRCVIREQHRTLGAGFRSCRKRASQWKFVIRVLLVIPTLDASGAEKQFASLASRLPRDRFEPHVVALTRSGPYERLIHDADVPITVLGKRLKADPVAWARLRRLVRRLQPDVMHTWLFAANAYGRLVATGDDAPAVIVSERCVDTWKSGWQLWLDRKLAGRTAALVGNSESVAEFYRQQGIPADKITTVPNGIDVKAIDRSQRAAVLAELGLPTDARIVASIGRLAKQKRVDVLVWGMQLLRQLSPNVFHLIIGDGPERARLERLAEHFTCHDVTRFVGHRNDVAKLLSCIDILWLASEFEGQSNSVMEAMAAGLPVIASDIPANRELITNGKHGYLVRPGDSVAFAQYADRLLADSELAERLGQAARQRIIDDHSVEAMIQAYANLYESVVARRKANLSKLQTPWQP